MQATLEIDGREVFVDYSVYGRYHPATYSQPAEYPEVEIEKLTVIGKRGKPLRLSEKQETAYFEKHEGQIYDAINEDDLSRGIDKYVMDRED